jgi:hypothetical protein
MCSRADAGLSWIPSCSWNAHICALVRLAVGVDSSAFSTRHEQVRIKHVTNALSLMAAHPTPWGPTVEALATLSIQNEAACICAQPRRTYRCPGRDLVPGIIMFGVWCADAGPIWPAARRFRSALAWWLFRAFSLATNSVFFGGMIAAVAFSHQDDW